MSQLLLSVDNLHCINCVGRVEKIISAQPGVTEVRVNLSKKQARVELEESSFSLDSCLDSLDGQGYPCRVLSHDQNQRDQKSQGEERQLLIRMGLAGCVAMNLMMMSASIYIGKFQGIDQSLQRLFEIFGFVLATPVVFLCGRQFLEPAWRALRSGSITMDVPISVGMLATYTLSTISFLFHGPHQYFDSVTAFVFVLLVGRYLQGTGMARVRSSLDLLLGLRPSKVVIRRGANELEIPVGSLEVGDLIVLQTGDAIPADGSVLEGQLEVDESSMTGEALPVSRGPGGALLSGTSVFSGQALMRADAVGGETVLDRLAALVEGSYESRDKEGRLSSLIAARFSAAILGLAALVFLLWLPQGWVAATTTAVSVLVITCPCALGLALPLAYWMAVKEGAQRGVLFKEQGALEMSARLTDLVFDKTGTLTMGRPGLVEEWLSPEESETSVGPLVEFLERTSPHPYARCLVERYSDFRGPEQGAEEVLTLAGRGRQATLGADTYFLGRPPGDSPHDIELLKNGERLASWRFDDPLRPEAAKLVQALRSRGIRLHLASGDKNSRVRDIAQRLGIDSAQGEMLPQDKEEWIARLQAEGGVVGLVGDGVNDAPALARADAGAAMGHAAQVATASAPVLLLRPGLAPVVEWLNLASAHQRTVRSSLHLSLLYNCLAVPTAALGWISPLLAAIVMPLSSLVVVTNSLKLHRRI